MSVALKVLAIIGLILLIPLAIYVEVWVIHWAVNLFTTISMWQAFGIAVLLQIFGTTRVRVSR